LKITWFVWSVLDVARVLTPLLLVDTVLLSASGIALVVLLAGVHLFLA
jgi:hypothetical protein